eukprot:514889_1
MYSSGMIDEIVEYKFGISYKIFNNLLEIHSHINQSVNAFKLNDMTNKWPQLFDTIDQEKQTLNDENRKILRNTSQNNQQQTRIHGTTKEEQLHNSLCKDLEEKTLDETDVQTIKQKVMKLAGIINPLILCISTQKQRPTILTNTDYIVINGEKHKNIKDELMNVLKSVNNNALYDAIIVILISICQTQQNTIKYFYDKTGERRHIDKLKKDIVYRLDLDLMTVLFDSSKTAKLEINDAHAVSRPGPAMDHLGSSNLIFWMKSKMTSSTESKINNH